MTLLKKIHNYCELVVNIHICPFTYVSCFVYVRKEQFLRRISLKIMKHSSCFHLFLARSVVGSRHSNGFDFQNPPSNQKISTILLSEYSEELLLENLSRPSGLTCTYLCHLNHNVTSRILFVAEIKFR